MISLYLSNRNLQILIAEGGKTLRVTGAYHRQIAEGCMINGVITDAELLRSELEEVWTELKLPRKGVRFISDSSQYHSRALRVPTVSDKETLSIIEKELKDSTEGDVVIDFMRFIKRPHEKTELILCSAVKRSLLATYLTLFEKMGIQLESVSTALSASLKLVDLGVFGTESTYALLVADGEVAGSVLIENGLYKFATRTRLFSEPETEGFANEIRGAVSGLSQFLAAEKSEYKIESVFMAGYSDKCLAMCNRALSGQGLKASRIPDTPKISFLGTDGCLDDFMYTAGDLIRR